MQVSSTLIAAQQAAREAQARLHVRQAAAPAGGEKAFSALPLKQTAPAPPPAQAPAPAGPLTRPGANLDIRV